MTLSVFGRIRDVQSPESFLGVFVTFRTSTLHARRTLNRRLQLCFRVFCEVFASLLVIQVALRSTPVAAVASTPTRAPFPKILGAALDTAPSPIFSISLSTPPLPWPPPRCPDTCPGFPISGDR